MSSPRFQLRSLTAYGALSGGGDLVTDYWVADTWDCNREAATFYAQPEGRPWPKARLASAEAECARLNAWHDQAMQT